MNHHHSSSFNKLKVNEVYSSSICHIKLNFDNLFCSRFTQFSICLPWSLRKWNLISKYFLLKTYVIVCKGWKSMCLAWQVGPLKIHPTFMLNHQDLDWDVVLFIISINIKSRFRAYGSILYLLKIWRHTLESKTKPWHIEELRWGQLGPDSTKNSGIPWRICKTTSTHIFQFLFYFPYCTLIQYALLSERVCWCYFFKL